MTSSAPRPPEPSRIESRLELRASQWIALGSFVLIAGLALVRVLGSTRAIAEGVSPSLSWRVEYPERLTTGRRETLHLTIDNVSEAPLDSLIVAFDPRYLEGFADISFEPSPVRPWIVVLHDIPSGETRHVTADLEAMGAGRHRGEIVMSTTSDEAALTVETLIYP